jgi:hypothetical protein
MPSYRTSKHLDFPRDQHNTRNEKISILKVTTFLCNTFKMIFQQWSSLPWPSAYNWTKKNQVVVLQPDVRESRQESNRIILQ